MLYSLTYLSVALEPFSETALTDLLRQSRDRNTSAALTGMLLYKSGSFIQALEGDQHAVEALFARISKDPRHHNLLRMASGPIERRSFASWSMGFQNLSKSSPTGFSTFLSSSVTAEDFGSSLAQAQRLLMLFKDTM